MSCSPQRTYKFLLVANLRSSYGSATSMMPPGRLRRIDRRLIHRSAWRNCLENRVVSRIVVPKAAKWGRRRTHRPLPAAKEARLKGLRVFSKQLQKVNSQEFRIARDL